MGATRDPAKVEIGLDHARRRDEVRVVVDGAGDPVDVGRLEGCDLAQGVVVKLAAGDYRGLSFIERWGRRPAKVAQLVADQRTRRR